MASYYSARRPAAGAGVHEGASGATDNEDAAAALLQQLAALMQSQGGDAGAILARLTTQAQADAAADGGAATNSENDNDEREVESSFKRRLFHGDAGPGASSYGSRTRQPQRHQHQHIPSPISERERRWYAEERSLLRELVVLTMRHSNGLLLRYVPSEEEQAALLDGESRFAPNIVAEGVRTLPKLEVLPPWSRSDDDINGSGANNGAGEDLAFRSKLSHPLLGSGARDAIALCGECGWLYGRIAAYVESVLEDDVEGVRCGTARALAARLDMELGNYHEQLALLEGELPPLELTPTSAGDGAQSFQYLTLRALAARVPPLRDHLRTLAILAEGSGARHLRGGKLLASILRHSLDGHTKHSQLVRSIAADCAVPFYRLLAGWIARGELDDVHSEFFVREVRPEEVGGDAAAVPSSGFFTWHQRYVLVEGLIPLCSCGGVMDIITPELAKEVLIVGKGINFVRHCLRDREWEVVETKDDEMEESSDEDRGYNFATLMDVTDDDDELRCVSTLHDAVMTSSARIHSHILSSLEHRHHLTRHLRALKDFLFLGQGDFVSSFVESLDAEFRGRTSLAGIYSHTLAAVLEGSLQTTNARFLPNFVLGNLRARLRVDRNDPDRYAMGPPPKKAEAEEMVPWKDADSSGDDDASVRDPWDYVYLDYKINLPLDAVVHASAKETYRRVSHFLIRLKRAEWMLNASWRQSTALNHAILVETRAGGADAPAIGEAAERASFLLRRIASTRQSMLHFVSNLQNYLMFEVLEGGWEGLVASLGRARTLDDVIRAHDSYLNEIVDKALLGDDTSDGGGLEGLLRKLLAIALTFGKFQDHIFGNALAGLDKAARIRRRVEERAEKGEWGRTTLDKEEGRVFVYLAEAALFEFVERSATEFDRTLSDLLKTMSKQIDEVDFNPIVDDDQDEAEPVMKSHDALPFLLFRLDFSGYYARQARERRRKEKQAA